MVSAGDVERYAYCARNGWLADQGHDPGGPGALASIRAHEEAQEALRTVRAETRLRRQAWRWFIRLLAVVSAGTMLTLVSVFLGWNGIGFVMAILSLVLLAGAASLTSIAGIADRRANRARRVANVQGDVHAGSGSEGPLLVDDATGLRGTPDYILETDKGFVPVQLKSGRTPEEPFQSHVLQLGCYLRLVEASSGTPPPHGLLTYPQGTFVLTWDDAYRERVDAAIANIAAIRASSGNGPDRDHEEAGRCRGCARRSVCDQSLA